MVLPGFGTGDQATALMRRYLKSLGYRVRGWQLGRNLGNVPALIPRVLDQLAEFERSRREAVRLVGWSLGGNLAREAARERPDLVDRVITLGTPVVGGPRYTSVAGVYERRGYDLSKIEAYVDQRNAIPIEVPVTAIYSRRDGVVSWQACLDHSSPRVEHVEVPSSHTGMLFNATVLREVAIRLAPAVPERR